MTTTTTFIVLDGTGAQYNVEADLNGTTLTLHSVPEVLGAAISNANPLFISQANVTAVAASAFAVLIGNSPVTVFPANSIIGGAVITNPATATESLFVDYINTPATATPGANGTTIEVKAGVTLNLPAGLTNAVKAVAATNNHAFVAYRF